MNTLNHCRKLAERRRAGCFLALFLLAGLLALWLPQAAAMPATNTPSAIPWNEIGAKAGADYQGDGLAVTPTGSGARLHCVFQRLDGEATPEGLWLTSTVTNTVSDRFRVTAMAVGRVTPCAPGAADRTSNIQHPTSNIQLENVGIISISGQTVRLSRTGLTEEYSVSLDGVRQDFIVESAPPRPPAGELVVTLAVSGAQVEAAADGARLVLDHSGRKLAYSRLRVTDATGKELPARMEVASDSDVAASRQSAAAVENKDGGGLPTRRYTRLAVVVNDADAVYPVRIDPTFSDANWVSMGGIPGANGSVSAAVTDGSGNLYIGGNFTIVGNTIATNIAKWNGSSWSALGLGISGEDPSYNGTYVSALAVSGSTLYAGGVFTTAGGSAANYIARWNGSSWSAIGSGLSGVGANGDGPFVAALAVSGGTLYVGGDFTNAGGNAASCIAQWNGSSWSALGSGMSGVGDGYGPNVKALVVSGSTLYAGGDFTNAGGSVANCIARWNGSSWSALGLGISGEDPYYNGPYVSALAVSGSTLYAGGDFTNAGGSAANDIAQWNGSSWSALGSGMDNEVWALAVSGGTLYAGGDFLTAGGSPANYIAQWKGSSWSGLGGLGANSSVDALAVSGSTLYVGGSFLTAGGSPANGIAQCKESSWSALGSGISDGGLFNFTGVGLFKFTGVYALAVSGSTLYVGGGFLTAGGSPANNIARWNGSSWSALGLGISGGGYVFVNALAVSGGTLYAGGEFATAGGSTVNSIAQWNGSSWSALGSGMYGTVWALAVSGNTLYAGGSFSSAGGSAANSVAQWNGTGWSALGLGVNGEVDALAVSGSTLYVGGEFGTAGGGMVNNIAQWNGSSWSALGSGMNNYVEALTVSGSTLYAGGNFTNAGGSAANYIAQWDGSSWSALGSGMNNYVENSYVEALTVSGSTLYAGGDFTTAGTNVSAYVARANLAGTQASPAIITTNTAFGVTSGLFGFDVSGLSGASVIIEASTNLQTWIPLQTNQLNGGLLYFSDPQPPTNARLFYRAQLSP